MKVQTASYGLHWFRRDLRTFGNPAWEQLVDEHKGRVLGIFCFDKKFLSRPDFSAIRFQFFLKTLLALKEELRARGSDLLFCDIGPDAGFADLFKRLKKGGQPLPATLSWNRDYEPFAIARDQRLQGYFREQGIHTVTERDHILLEPHEIVKTTKPSGPYQIYTPYSRKWLQAFETQDVQERLGQQARGLKKIEKFRKGKLEKDFELQWKNLLEGPADGWDVFQDYLQRNAKKVSIAIPEAGSLVAVARLKEFADQVSDYEDSRNFPAIDGTSRFSIYFKNGTLTTAQVIAALELTAHEKKGREVFLKELIWREFSYYILAKHPEVEGQAFDSRFARLDWEDNPKFLQAWKDGNTGFPIVDAGMRQLNETGWMHNRVRMIVASFLTKDLLVNWQHGEAYFMDKLLDGDLAPNNMGWQWAASTGCDAQPYFRIFNPLLQSQKFDAKGEYIRSFIPELRHVKGKSIHAPSAADRGRAYPPPIVDHSRQREQALALYKRNVKRS
jgi:deoxyribodipyrimidine photo-lyase